MENHNLEKVIIIGGGVAGLSCLNALLDHGIPALLLEGGTIGAPKMCGEFLAPIAVQQLHKWGVTAVVSISQANFYSGDKQLDIKFTQASGAISRSEVERQLATRARKLGGRIRENTYLQHTTPATSSTPYLFQLSSDEVIEAKSVFFATGKFGNIISSKKIKLPYYGFKLHFHHLEKVNSLKMFSLENAYLGIVPISDEISNCACLAKQDAVEKFGSAGDYFNQIIRSNYLLKDMLSSVDLDKTKILSGKAPDFFQKKLQVWPESYWIGDAFASLYPAIGSGFSHSITSATQAVYHFINNNPKIYQKTYSKSIKSKVVIGKLLNTALLNPRIVKYALPILNKYPGISNLILRKLDYL